MRQVCSRCRTADDWSLQRSRHPQGYCGHGTVYPPHRVPRPRITKRWATAHADYDAVLFNETTLWQHRWMFRCIWPLPHSCKVSLSATALPIKNRRCLTRQRPNNFKICNDLPHHCGKMIGTVYDAKEYHITHGTIERMETCLISYSYPAASPDGRPQRCSDSTCGCGASSEPRR